MARPRDNQRSKVYAWERQYHISMTADVMTLAECKQLADKVCRHAKLPKVEVKDGRGTRRAHSYGGSIGLPVWARQPVVVLHEMAHELAPYLYPRTGGRYGIAPHGREFTGVHMYLLVKFAGYDIKEMVRSANDARVLFDSIHEVKRRLREWRRRSWVK